MDCYGGWDANEGFAEDRDTHKYRQTDRRGGERERERDGSSCATE
jgi:hypothetical protein